LSFQKLALNVDVHDFVDEKPRSADGRFRTALAASPQSV